jgi:hypothetical protein
MTRVVQLTDGTARRVALVDEPSLRLLAGVATVHQLATLAAEGGLALSHLAAERATGEAIDYDEVYERRARWRLLPPIDHPADPARCMVSGTGLTHFGSARDRHAMHAGPPSQPGTTQPGAADAAGITDSLRMFQAGVEAGRPEPGAIGVAPEWFYKGTGTMLRGHGDALTVPFFAEDGGEEAEIAGVYLIASDGTPCRIGLAAGNEFSDHRFERRNYLNLAGSKLRTAAIGPELVLAAHFGSIPGDVRIERDGRTIWQRRVASGEAEMSHSLANVEHHHFKFEAHRRPGDVHVHFFGAHSISFGDGVTLADGDAIVIAFDGFGRPLRNTVRVEAAEHRPVEVRPLG